MKLECHHTPHEIERHHTPHKIGIHTVLWGCDIPIFSCVCVQVCGIPISWGVWHSCVRDIPILWLWGCVKCHTLSQDGIHKVGMNTTHPHKIGICVAFILWGVWHSNLVGMCGWALTTFLTGVWFHSNPVQANFLFTCVLICHRFGDVWQRPSHMTSLRTITSIHGQYSSCEDTCEHSNFVRVCGIPTLWGCGIPILWGEWHSNLVRV
jgi:hypothetical protein